MRTFLAATLWSVLVSSAHAQWHMDGYIGGAATRHGDIRLQQPSTATDLQFQDVAFEGRSLAGPLYYGFRAGRALTSRFALEGEFIHLKVFADVDEPVAIRGTLNGVGVNAFAPPNPPLGRFNISHGANLLLANVVVRQPLIAGKQPRGPAKLAVAARVGLGTVIPHGETTINGVAREGYEISGFSWQLAAGLEYRVWRRLYAVGEYKFTRARPEIEVANGTANARLLSHHGVLGLGLRF